ncbi:hypothetical protein AGMMS49982_06990 [Bacteroidia bacterium]|nr:hypothetical protein AGMMS49982_06990 [Bacteroidia bacterium]
MKSFRKFIRTDVARHVSTFMVAAMFLLPSCSDYLDVVPDNVATLEDIFSRKSEAWNALAKVYSYMPEDDRVNMTTWTLGDDYQVYRTNTTEKWCLAPLLMQGQQTTGDPLLGNWSGTKLGTLPSGGKPLYEGIRVCNIFLQYIDGVGDMDDSEKRQWAAQAKFMKAYYHFLLLQKYGPIVISDHIVSADAVDDEMFTSRSKVEDCFKYIIRVMTEAISDLELKTSATALGQVDKIAATAIKARVLLFRASPFFNGNRSFYESFLDHDGEPFFPMTEEPEKWKETIDAVDEAIQLCLDNGLDLYTYAKGPYSYDVEDYAISDTLKRYYNLRMVVADPWNKELIWGLSNIALYDGAYLGTAAQIIAPTGLDLAGGNTSNSFAWNWLAATYQVAERYYTRNGLPIDEDLTFDMSTMHNLVMTPGPTTDSVGYEGIRGLLQPQTRTINFHLNRELRFYANLGISGGYWRSHVNRIPVTFYPTTAEGWNTGKRGNDYLCTGIGVQKFVHPESKAGYWSFTVRTPMPIIRMADLYLMKAEAMNEYYGSSQDVYDALNKVRRRAGIPDVEVVWADPALARHPSSLRDKGEMRNIILRERGIELAFEGSRYWDMVRHKRAHLEFNSPIMGWSVEETNPSNFFIRRPVQANRFSSRDYLWPIDLDEMNTNNRLIQNPGW